MEGIECFGQDEWEKVAAQVETKNAQECLEYFLSMPILENVLDHDLHSVWKTLAGHALNPLMTLLFIFTIAVSPPVAAESASAVLKNVSSHVLTESGDLKPYNLLLKEWTKEATQIAFDAGIQYALQFVKEERQRIKSMILKLTDLQIKLVEWKMGVLEELLSGNQN